MARISCILNNMNLLITIFKSIQCCDICCMETLNDTIVCGFCIWIAIWAILCSISHLKFKFDVLFLSESNFDIAWQSCELAIYQQQVKQWHRYLENTSLKSHSFHEC